MWKHLNHPNIVPFKGVTPTPLELVSEWMPGGRLREPIRYNPHNYRSNLISLVSRFILACGHHLFLFSAARRC